MSITKFEKKYIKAMAREAVESLNKIVEKIRDTLGVSGIVVLVGITEEEETTINELLELSAKEVILKRIKKVTRITDLNLDKIMMEELIKEIIEYYNDFLIKEDDDTD